LGPVHRTGEALSPSQTANRSSMGLSSRSESVTRRAGCGRPARPDLRGGRGGNSSVYPTVKLALQQPARPAARSRPHGEANVSRRQGLVPSARSFINVSISSPSH
jgi:hypothetical protein